MKTMLLAIVLLATLSSSASTQVQLATWNVPTDYTSAFGQAQGGAILATENIGLNAIRFDPSGFASAFVHVGSPNFATAIETTDGFVVAVRQVSGWVAQYAPAGGGLLREYFYPGVVQPTCGTIDLIPLDDGQVLVAVGCQTGNEFHVFDRDLQIVGTIPGRGGAAFVVGLTRRPDGSFVACTRVSGSAAQTRLTAYTLAGSVLWDAAIPGSGGSVAADAAGAIYVCRGDNASVLDVFTPTGTFDHAWSGPPADPFSFVRDIASSLDGGVLYTLAGPKIARSFGSLPTATRTTSWSRVKRAYR